MTSSLEHVMKTKFKPHCFKSQFMAKKILTLIFLLFVLAFLSIVFFNKQVGKSEEATFNLGLETPNIKDPKLAKFYLWTKEDPLFTSPDFDTKKLYQAVESLEMEESDYIKMLGRKEKLFPTVFLKGIADVSDAANSFLKFPDAKKAEDLINEYRKVTDKYEKARSALFLFLNSKSFNKNYSYHGINTSTSFKIVLSDLDKLKENTKGIKKEIDDRETCLKKGIGCRRPASFFKEPEYKEKYFSFSKQEILPNEDLMIDSISNQKFYGPYIASTPCFGGEEAVDGDKYLFYVIKGKEERNFLSSKNKLDVMTQKIATTNFYRNLKVEQGGADKYFADKGYRQFKYPETNIYTCQDSSYKTKLAALHQFYSHYKNERIFKKLLSEPELESAQKKLFEGGIVLEDKFFDSEFPSEQDAEILASFYAYTYKNIIFWGMDDPIREKKWFKNVFAFRDKILQRYLVYSRRLSKFDEILADAIGRFSSFRLKSLLEKQDTYLFAYPFRSMYGLVYFPFSQSFYRLDSPLTYIQKESSNEIYVPYKKLLQKYKKEEIRKWNSASITSYLEDEYKKLLKEKEASSAAK